MRRCPFCFRVLEIVDGGGLVTETWACPDCDYQESHGMEKLPNPEKLRSRARHLEDVADALEEPTPLANALRRFAH